MKRSQLEKWLKPFRPPYRAPLSMSMIITLGIVRLRSLVQLELLFEARRSRVKGMLSDVCFVMSTLTFI